MLTIGQAAPQPEVQQWVQGYEPEMTQLAGQVILIEVIQVNCPGCFVHALPEAIRLHEHYAEAGLKVFAIATAFEHYQHNTLNNLQRLLQTGELQGDPLQQLGKAGFLDNGKLPYTIPFSVAMDKLVPCNTQVDESSITKFILSQLPDFFEKDWGEARTAAIYQQAEAYLQSKTYQARTFDMYQLQGTPSSILIDKQGRLNSVSFGNVAVLEGEITRLLES